MVGSAHDVFVVFHHNDRIAHIAKFLKHVDKAFGVARVQTDGGFVEDVETAHQTTAEGGGEVDALAFSSGETVGEAVESEIVEAHFFEEMQAVVDFRQQALCHLLFVVGELELGKPESEFFNRHFHEVGNGFSSHFDVECFWAESFSSAIRTSGFAAIASEHHAVLDFILSHLEGFEKSIDAHIHIAFFPRHSFATMPEQIALFFGEIVIGFKDGEVVLLSTAQEFFAPHTQFFAAPAHHSSIIDREGGVGDDEMLIDAHDFAKTFTAWASSHGGVEREKIVGGFFKGDAVGFESGGEMFQILLGIEAQEAFSIAFKESGFHRVGKSRNAVFGTIDSEAVEEEKESALVQCFGAGFDG